MNMPHIHNWRPDLQLEAINGGNNKVILDFNRLLYLGVPNTKDILTGKGLKANRNNYIEAFKAQFDESLASNSTSQASLVEAFRHLKIYLTWCDQVSIEPFYRDAVNAYCNHLYQRTQRREIKRTTYKVNISILKTVLVYLDCPTAWFDDVIILPGNDTESYEAYSRSDLNQLLSLLRAIFKQTAKQFTDAPDKHMAATRSTPTMLFHWQGQDYPLCSGISKMMAAATYLLAYYTYSNSTQLYQLKRPQKASFSTQDKWCSMPAFKRRAFKVVHIEMGEHTLDIPKYSMTFFDTLLTVSRHLDNSDNALLLQTCSYNQRRPISGALLTTFVSQFLKIRFPMQDNRGRELRPQISRFRETGNQLTQLTQGDIVAGYFLNNTSSTRKRSYATGNKYENNRMMQETTLIRAEQAKTKQSVREIRGKLSLTVLTYDQYQQRFMPNLSSSAHGTHCAEPFGKKANKFNRKTQSHQLNQGQKLACADLLACFGCEHQVIVQSIDDIWCLLSFKECVEESLFLHLNHHHYKQNFQVIINFIEDKILPELTKTVLNEARNKLDSEGQHPLWQEAQMMTLLAQKVK